jgi:FMN reductase
MTARSEDRASAFGGVRVLGIGGSTRPGSNSEKALRIATHAAEGQGAAIELITGRGLMLPIYDTESSHRSGRARRLLAGVRGSDALIISSPGYHGTLSGLVKNALDYLEDLRDDERPYLDGMAVGCISVAYGAQATASTLQNLRVAAHALRGWPSPLGAAINTAVVAFDEHGGCSEETARAQLQTVGQQVAGFAATHKRAAHRGGGGLEMPPPL